MVQIIMEEDRGYKCSACGWEGMSSDLVFDDVETCFGSDKVEMCPKCSSYEVVFVKL